MACRGSDGDGSAVREAEKRDGFDGEGAEKIIRYGRDVVVLVQIESVQAAAVAMSPHVHDGAAVAGCVQKLCEPDHRWMASIAPEPGDDQHERSRGNIPDVVVDLGAVERDDPAGDDVGLRAGYCRRVA